MVAETPDLGPEQWGFVVTVVVDTPVVDGAAEVCRPGEEHVLRFVSTCYRWAAVLIYLCQPLYQRERLDCLFRGVAY